MGECVGYSASMLCRFGLVLLLLAAASPVSAQTFETAGVRALGMGGAFVGVADDASAVWWNPAGLATGPFFSLAIEHSRFEQRRPLWFGEPPAERSSFFLSVASLPLGLSYVKTGEHYVVPGPADEAVGRELRTHQIGATVLQSLSDAVVVGATLKYVRGIASSGPVGSPLEDRAGNAFDADLSVMATSGPIKAGLTIRNIFSPEFEAADGSTQELHVLARAGVSYLAAPALTFAADVDIKGPEIGPDRRRMLALGGEYRLSRASVRAGARFDTIGPVNALGTVGGSYAVRNGIWVDVWAATGKRDADRGWGLAGRFTY